MTSTLRGLRVVALLSFLAPAAVRAEPAVISAVFDPTAGPNEYVVQFPLELGGETIYMPITGGRFDLEVDAEADTAKLLSWTQEVEPISIYGMSTGPISITMDTSQPSTGTYDREANSAFSVSAVFLVSFDDTELSQVGFVSPFVLDGTETGYVSGLGSLGRVHMALDGFGAVSGSEFTYTCKTTARFDVEQPTENQAQAGDVNMDRTLDLSDPVGMLFHLFASEDIACAAAIEVNGDGSADLTDAVHVLEYLFRAGPVPLDTLVDCD